MRHRSYRAYALAVIALSLGAFSLVQVRNRSNKESASLEAPEQGSKKIISENKSPPAVDGFSDYAITAQRERNSLACRVTFHRLPETDTIASAVVRRAVEDLAKVEGRQNIRGLAFDPDGNPLPGEQYGGPLSYSPTDGKVLSVEERNGLSVQESHDGEYFARVSEKVSAEGIQPKKRWYTVQIVFSEPPADAKRAMVKEIDKLRSRQCDVYVYVYQGDMQNKVTWKQVPSASKAYMSAIYDTQSGEITPSWEWDAPTAGK